MSDHFEHADISAIIPIGGRSGDLTTLFREYRRALESLGGRCEFILVLDGPRPRAEEQIEILLQQGEKLTVIELTRSFGESTALTAGFQRASAPVIVTLPSYDQVDATEITKLVRALDKSDMAVAHRWPRAGGAWESARRRVFHRTIGRVTGQTFRDLGCGVRAFKRRVLEEIALYGDQHRFLPVLAARQGFRVVEVDLRQSSRDRFEGTYKPRDYMRRALDIFSIFFLVRFTKRPLRFFGMVGATTFGLGVAVLALLVVERLFLDQPLASRPALLLASLLVVLGLQVFALGLLGELIIFTHARELKDYQVDRIYEFPQKQAASVEPQLVATTDARDA